LNDKNDYQYRDALVKVLYQGISKDDRTGTGTRSYTGIHMEFNLKNGLFPLITTKKVHFTSVVHELLWFLKGETNIKYLTDNGVRIWNEWSDENGDLGPVYGKQWRSWETKDGRVIDQIQEVIEEIKNNPDSRRMIVSAWNVGELDDMALMPCHAFFQFVVTDGYLDCILHQRSADMFLGVPFNIASYSLLTYMVAEVTGLKPGKFVWNGGDCHIYDNHVEQVREQLLRYPFSSPTLTLTPRDNINDFTFEDIQLHGYESHPAIKAKVAV